MRKPTLWLARTGSWHFLSDSQVRSKRQVLEPCTHRCFETDTCISWCQHNQGNIQAVPPGVGSKGMPQRIFLFPPASVAAQRYLFISVDQARCQQGPYSVKSGAPQSRGGDLGGCGRGCGCMCMQGVQAKCAEMQLSSLPAKSCSTSPAAQRTRGAPGGVLTGQGFPGPGSAEGSPGGA